MQRTIRRANKVRSSLWISMCMKAYPGCPVVSVLAPENRASLLSLRSANQRWSRWGFYTLEELTHSLGIAISICKELGIVNIAYSYMHFFLSCSLSLYPDPILAECSLIFCGPWTGLKVRVDAPVSSAQLKARREARKKWRGSSFDWFRGKTISENLRTRTA